MQKKANWIIAGILSIYFCFTSGLIFEVTQSEATDRIDIPYSIGLSAERTGLTDVATQDDINVLNWLSKNWDYKMPIIGDYNSYCLIQAHVIDYYSMTLNQRQGDLTHMPNDCWIFISSWNTQHNKYIEAVGIGMRKSFPLPEIKQTVAYRSGDSLVYKKQTPLPQKG